MTLETYAKFIAVWLALFAKLPITFVLMTTMMMTGGAEFDISHSYMAILLKNIQKFAKTSVFHYHDYLIKCEIIDRKQ